MSFTPSENPITHPERESYTVLRPFRFWCQKVLPLVYDDSLSYYELLCKVVDYLNKTMEDVDHMNTDMDTLYSSFQEFQAGSIRIYNELVSYVNTYFDNLDVQEEINAKLDAMVQDGSLVTILQPSIANEVSEWLSEHLTPTEPSIDNTLTVSGAGADSKTVGDIVGDFYSNSKSYLIGDIVIQNGKLYCCIENTSGSFDSSKWEIVNEANEISSLKKGFTNQNIFEGALKTSKYIKYPEGTMVNGTYYTTQHIKVYPGEKYEVSVTGSTSTYGIVLYDANGNILTGSVRNTGNQINRTIVIPDDCVTIRICSNTNNSVLRKLPMDNFVDYLSVSETSGNLFNMLPYMYGYVSSSNGLIVSSDSYVYTELFKVNPNDVYRFKSNGSAGVFLFAMYDSNGNAADLRCSYKGNGQANENIMIIPKTISFIRICCLLSYASECVLEKVNIVNVNNVKGFSLKTRNLCQGLPIIPYLFRNGSTTEYGNHFFTVDDIPVRGSTKYYIYCDGRTRLSSHLSARFITEYDSNDDVVNVLPNVDVNFTTNANTVKISVTFFTKYELTNGSVYNNIGYYYISDYYITNNYGIFNSLNQFNYKAIDNSKIFYEQYRRCTINFTFDDNDENDSLLYDLFTKLGATCGFGLITGDIIDNQRLLWYRDINKEGFSILCHSNDGTPMGDNNEYTDEELKAKMLNTQILLETCGMKVNGWITPSSFLKRTYIPTLEKYYDYGFTTYFGAYNGTGTPYNTLANKPSLLKRVHVGNSTIANLKQAVDVSIQNNGLLCFYGHGYELTNDTLDINKLVELILYIKDKEREKECYLLSPDDSYVYYYRERVTY